jgi:type II secretory pathway component PulF
MPRYRYHATSRTGTPIYGSEDAASESELRALLQSRGQNLLHSSMLTLDPSISISGRELPRLAQLRLGAQLREAFLTDLPAHDAIRAMAAEPFRHPMLALMPWTAGLFGALVICGVLTLTAISPNWDWSFAAAVVLITVTAESVLWFAMRYVLDLRPRRFLRTIADRLEAGEQNVTDLLPMMPGELREVMQASASADCRARAAAELVPSLIGTRLHAHRFAFSIFGPMLLCGVVFVGLYAVLLFVIPGFVRIFSDFGVEVPSMTLVVANMSKLLQSGGTQAFWISCVLVGAVLIISYILLMNLRVAQFLSTIPVFGVPFRWLMQARVARVLGALIRHGCSEPEALRAATAASGFESIRSAGKQLADQAVAGGIRGGGSNQLNALPIASLMTEHRPPREGAETRTESVAHSLNSLANMLEQASEGHGRLIGLVVQCTVILVGGTLTGMIVLALFMPLIKLLNGLV